MTSRRGAVVALTTAALVALAGAAPALAATTGGADGGRLVAVHESVGTVVVDVSPAVAARLARLAGVRSVTRDGVARLQTLGYTPSSQSGSMTNVTRLTGARDAWRRGITGAGVDVAVIDTGTTPVASLKQSSKVVVGPDLSFDSQALNLRYLDGYGHGTHMASVIAGRDVAPAAGATYAADTKNLYGMAPDARVVSVKVGDHNGAVDVSQLIAAIDWVVQNRRTGGLNVRVLNLSFGTDTLQSFVVDPLSFAAEVAWNNGIFVVASAGNDGSTAAGLANPAYNNNIFAVGAVDTRGTDQLGDDVVPAFSQHPNSTSYQREPDLVAPGVGIVAAGVPGSMLWTSYPTARLGTDQFRGSGTSQSAAVVSGAAALVLQRWPDATPDQVKELLTRTATPLPNTSAALQGRGELNVAAALNSAPQADSTFAGGSRGSGRKAVGTGSLELSRGSNHLMMDGVVLIGERDIMGASWSGALTSLLTRNTRMWSAGGIFNGNQWIGDGFTPDQVSVAGRTWGGRSWAGRSWAGRSRAGTQWSGRSWATTTWNGRSWAGQSWTVTGWGSSSPAKGFTSTRTGPKSYGAAAVPRPWGTAAWR
jgi:serine protease AprX